jgi:hypothetical protein
MVKNNTTSSQSAKRLKRLRSFSRLLDSSIPLPGGYRIGLDGFLGLIPGIGDIAGGLASSYIIIEAAQLGASTMTLLRMVFNVLLESLVGIIPFFGDIFDFVWKANDKNFALLEKQLHTAKPDSSPERRLQKTGVILVILMLSGLIALAYLSFLILRFLIETLAGAGAA